MRRRIGYVLAAALSLALGGLGCGPEFPPFWLIEPDPLNASGQIDPAGKLRVLGLRADPPEAAPGEKITVRALVAIHPQQGRVLADQSRHEPYPQLLSALWLSCSQPEEALAPEPCGLAQNTAAQDLQTLPTLSDDAGTATELRLPLDLALPQSRIVTLLVADQALPGGAAACYAHAVQNQGVLPDPNHCVIAVKRIRISRDPVKNHNPEISRLWFGQGPNALWDLAPVPSRDVHYPLLDSTTPDEDRPSLRLVVERAADAVEMGSDADGQDRPEALSLSFFTTAGTLEAGRGSFLDLDCQDRPQNCPALLHTDVGWQAPAEKAARQASEKWVYFFVVLRDDRGGLSFMAAAVQGH